MNVAAHFKGLSGADDAYRLHNSPNDCKYINNYSKIYNVDDDGLVRPLVWIILTSEL